MSYPPQDPAIKPVSHKQVQEPALAQTNLIPDTQDSIINLELNLVSSFDTKKLKEFNSKTVDLMLENNIETALEILKKLEVFLEANAIESKLNLDKKILIIILHNLACCFQKLKDFENCIIYLEAVIYHFDSSLEFKHNIKISEEYFIKAINEDQSNYSLLGDFILELRFSAKFHLQMCAVLSQAGKHIEALKHAKLAALMCEDNLIKTNFLYKQLDINGIWGNGGNNRNGNSENEAVNGNSNGANGNENENCNNKNKEDLSGFTEKIKQSYRIINELFLRVLKIRGKDTNQYQSMTTNNTQINTQNNLNTNTNINSAGNFILNSTNTNLNTNNNSNIYTNMNSNTNNNQQTDPAIPQNIFNSYSSYRKHEISKFNLSNILTNNIRHIFGSSIKRDDWIQLLNIGNIMFLSALNYEDLDLDSDPKYELLRDAILEKVVMLTVAYFCIATELRFLSADKNNTKTNGKFYHFKAVEFASQFLPVSCPIVKHYIISYYKHYGQDMDVIPEGKLMNLNVDLIRSEIEIDKDTLTFVRTKKINLINNNKASNNNLNRLGLNNNNNTGSNINNYSNNILETRAKNISNNNFSEGNIELKGYSSRDNKDFNIFNKEELGSLVGKNYSLANKSKIKDDRSPKFKLNFNNLGNIFNNNNNSNNDNIDNQYINDIPLGQSSNPSITNSIKISQNLNINPIMQKIHSKNQPNNNNNLQCSNLNNNNNKNTKKKSTSKPNTNISNNNNIMNNIKENNEIPCNNRYIKGGSKTDRPRCNNMVQSLANSSRDKFKMNKSSNNNFIGNFSNSNNGKLNAEYKPQTSDKDKSNQPKSKGNLTDRIPRKRNKLKSAGMRTSDSLSKCAKTQRAYQKPKIIKENKFFINTGLGIGTGIGPGLNNNIKNANSGKINNSNYNINNLNNNNIDINNKANNNNNAYPHNNSTFNNFILNKRCYLKVNRTDYTSGAMNSFNPNNNNNFNYCNMNNINNINNNYLVKNNNLIRPKTKGDNFRTTNLIDKLFGDSKKKFWENNKLNRPNTSNNINNNMKNIGQSFGSMLNNIKISGKGSKTTNYNMGNFRKLGGCFKQK